MDGVDWGGVAWCAGEGVTQQEEGCMLCVYACARGHQNHSYAPYQLKKFWDGAFLMINGTSNSRRAFNFVLSPAYVCETRKTVPAFLFRIIFLCPEGRIPYGTSYYGRKDGSSHHLSLFHIFVFGNTIHIKINIQKSRTFFSFYIELLPENNEEDAVFFSYERPTYVEAIWKDKIGVYFKYTKPYACGFTFEPSWDQRRTLKNLPPLSSKKTQLTTKKATEHRHHGPPIPPPSSGSNSTGECDVCTLRDRSRSAQHGDIIFLRATNFF